jgi:hypothetical protein
MGLIKKNPLAGEIGVPGVSKLGEGFFFLTETVGRSYPHRLSLCIKPETVGRSYPTGLVCVLSRKPWGALPPPA